MIAAEIMPDTPMNANGRRFAGDEGQPSCYSLTIFTQKWWEVRQFYTEVLRAKVVSERVNRYCDMLLGGLPLTLRPCEFGEDVSYFHIYLTLRKRDGILREMQERGIVITEEGPYTNFRDPEGRVFKLSETEAILS